MKITVIGAGYVGLVAGLSFSKWGNEVVCLDVDKEKIQALQHGVCPIYEPGATTQLKDELKSGRLWFTVDAKEAISHGEIIFIAVGTPEQPDGNADLRYIYGAADMVVEHANSDKVVVDKSTVPVGTARELYCYIQKQLQVRGKHGLYIDVASNPEFLREGKAVGDFNNPDRIVLGVNTEYARERLTTLYSTFSRSNKPMIVTTPETAEMIKYASNAFLATKITFINEIANLCEQVHADIGQVTAAMGKDGRISSKFLHPGPGYGGSCFPKDTKALAHIGQRYGTPQTVVESVILANERQKRQAAERVKRCFPNGARLAVLGLSFKPETDDIRESPAIEIVNRLLETGTFILQLYDPKAMENAQMEIPNDSKRVHWCNSAKEAVEGTDAILIPTEWSEFTSLDFAEIGKKMRQKILFDFRNIYKKEQLKKLGFEYYGTGI